MFTNYIRVNYIDACAFEAQMVQCDHLCVRARPTELFKDHSCNSLLLHIAHIREWFGIFLRILLHTTFRTLQNQPFKRFNTSLLMTEELSNALDALNYVWGHIVKNVTMHHCCWSWCSCDRIGFPFTFSRLLQHNPTLHHNVVRHGWRDGGWWSQHVGHDWKGRGWRRSWKQVCWSFYVLPSFKSTVVVV